MKKGSPGGILAIAVGVLFLSLGWTGRYEAVWEALRTGEKATAPGGAAGPGPQNPVTDNNKSAAAIQDPISVVVASSGATKVADAPDLKGRNGSGLCSTGSTGVTLESNSSKKYCVANDKLFDPLPVTRDVQNMAGQVESEDYAYTQMPNGTQAFRYQPNAIGYFDA